MEKGLWVHKFARAAFASECRRCSSLLHRVLVLLLLLCVFRLRLCTRNAVCFVFMLLSLCSSSPRSALFPLLLLFALSSPLFPLLSLSSLLYSLVLSSCSALILSFALLCSQLALFSPLSSSLLFLSSHCRSPPLTAYHSVSLSSLLSPLSLVARLSSLILLNISQLLLIILQLHVHPDLQLPYPDLHIVPFSSQSCVFTFVYGIVSLLYLPTFYSSLRLRLPLCIPLAS